LTRDDNYSLVVDLWDSDGRFLFAKYELFKVGPENELYRLNLGPISGGNASDAMSYHNGQSFSTTDNDNDASTSNNCAKQSKVNSFSVQKETFTYVVLKAKATYFDIISIQDKL
jgi:hypothetical protein